MTQAGAGTEGGTHAHKAWTATRGTVPSCASMCVRVCISCMCACTLLPVMPCLATWMAVLPTVQVGSLVAGPPWVMLPLALATKQQLNVSYGDEMRVDRTRSALTAGPQAQATLR